MDVVIAQARRNMPVCAFPETGSGMNILCPRVGNRHGRLPQSAHFKIASRPVEPATFKLRFSALQHHLRGSHMRLVFAVLLLSCTCVSAQTLPAANNTFDTVLTQRIIQRTYATSRGLPWMPTRLLRPWVRGEWANSHVGVIIRASMPSKGEGRFKQTGLLYCLVCCLAYCTWIVNEEDAGAPGLVATRVPVPAAVRSDAGMATVTWVGSTMVVVR